MKAFTVLCFGFCLLLSCFAAFAGGFFKCVDSEGKIFYQESSCSGMTELKKKELSYRADSAGDPNDSSASVTVYSGPGGGYFTMASFNGYSYSAVVDTGASSVAFPAGIAAKIGLKCGLVGYSSTGNGLAQVCHTQVDTLKVGGITLHYVDAIIMPNLSTILLGQTALQRLKVSQENNQIILSVISGKTR